jgi:DNA-binding MarR family transcriptional regulator
LSKIIDNIVVDVQAQYPAAMTPPASQRSGADLALLLLGSYRRLVDTVIVELAERGYEDVRPGHDFAMRAILSGADNASELGRRLAMTKQGAARIIETLLERGYIARETDPDDARRKRIQVTALGAEVMRTGEAIFNDLRGQWEQKLGQPELARLEEQLTQLVGDAPIRLEAPGWIAQEDPAAGPPG